MSVKKVMFKINTILDVIFGEEKIEDQFAVSINGKENKGKIYLPVHISLENLNKSSILDFIKKNNNFKIIFQNNQVVIHV